MYSYFIGQRTLKDFQTVHIFVPKSWRVPGLAAYLPRIFHRKARQLGGGLFVCFLVLSPTMICMDHSEMSCVCWWCLST